MNDRLCLCDLLKAAAASCGRSLNEALEPLGLSHCQATILCALYDNGPATMSAVSQVLCCHKSNVTQVVDGLVKKGLLKRQPSAGDRRLRLLGLTSAGSTLAKKAQAILNKRAHECTAMYSKTERSTLTKLLERCLEERQK